MFYIWHFGDTVGNFPLRVQFSDRRAFVKRPLFWFLIFLSLLYKETFFDNIIANSKLKQLSLKILSRIIRAACRNLHLASSYRSYFVLVTKMYNEVTIFHLRKKKSRLKYNLQWITWLFIDHYIQVYSILYNVTVRFLFFIITAANSSFAIDPESE